MTLNNCLMCEHFKTKDDGSIYCKAYPEGIPEKVFQISDDNKIGKECANGVKYINKYE